VSTRAHLVLRIMKFDSVGLTRSNFNLCIAEGIRGIASTRGYNYAKIFLKRGKARKSKWDTANVAIATSPRICFL
jgi:hypothetical protein